jgi:hypothetical protein
MFYGKSILTFQPSYSNPFLEESYIQSLCVSMWVEHEILKQIVIKPQIVGLHVYFHMGVKHLCAWSPIWKNIADLT